MGAKMKANQKQTLLAERNLLQDKVEDILATIGNDLIYKYISDILNEDLEYMDDDIEDEANFAKENPPGSTYASAGAEARKTVKHLQKIKKQRQQLVKMYDNFLKLKTKIDKL